MMLVCYNTVKKEVNTMALPINIDELINQQVIESNRIEFKRDWDPTPIIHSICAFANDIDNVGAATLLSALKKKTEVPYFRYAV